MSAAAERLKNEANALFKAGKYSAAVAKYTDAIELDDNNAVYYSNRAFAQLKLENLGCAIQDASVSIEIDPSYVKGYYRRGSAYLQLTKFREGLADFRRVVRLKPQDPDARRKLRECEKALQKLRFEEAIGYAETAPAEFPDWRSMAVEDSYDGPRCPDSGLTRDFVVEMIAHFKAQKPLHRRYIYQLLEASEDVLKRHGTVMDIPIEEGNHFTVCGDVHGQYYDLLNIWELNGLPSVENPYLFNGDFVDRGSFSCECVIALLAWKCAHPTAMYLTRGNHETKNMNRIYGFDGEARHKYGDQVADLFARVFQYLPLAAVLQEKVMVVHGGLFSRDGVTLDDIRAVDRVGEPTDEGIMCEALWSDPQAGHGRAPSKRGVGVAFGQDVTDEFLSNNNLSLLVRSHEVKDEGYEVAHGGKCVTVFSAPNYCDSMGNKGAFIRFEHDCTPQYTQFTHVPHPDVRPMAYASSLMNFM
uniref:Serine/threonine-protein phosphatase T n=1 Tax=Prasinoderma coloniale TaxID=156133 RepID=A0A7R9TVH2_9VIRI|eukprot:PRCOL_00004674-RA